MEEIYQFKFWRYIDRKMGRKQIYLLIDELFVDDEQKQAAC